MKTIITVYKPTKILVDTTGCTTLQNLVRAIKDTDDSVLDFRDGSVYSIGTLRGSEFPAHVHNGMTGGAYLSGQGYSSMSPIPKIQDSRLDIIAIPKTSYRVYVTWNYRADRFAEYVTVKMQDQVLQLKKHIWETFGFAEISQIVSHEGRHLEDSAYLFEEGIIEDSVVTLSFMVEVTFQYKQGSKVVNSVSDGQLLQLLNQFAEEAGLDISTLRFMFTKTSGPVADCAQEWLADRAQLFKAKEAAGTIQQNGLTNGDGIQVFEVNSKRKRDDVDDDQAQVKDESENEDESDENEDDGYDHDDESEHGDNEYEGYVADDPDEFQSRGPARKIPRLQRQRYW